MASIEVHPESFGDELKLMPESFGQHTSVPFSIDYFDPNGFSSSADDLLNLRQ